MQAVTPVVQADQEMMEHKVQMVHEDLEVTKEIKETRADPVPREILEYRERMVNRVMLVLKETVVLLDPKDLGVLKETLDHQDPRELLDQKEPRDHKEQGELMVKMDHLDQLDLLDHQDPQVLLLKALCLHQMTTNSMAVRENPEW